ncbi:MAG TPA: hypothetical protein VF122_05915 [Caulobacteraceae bacterium]
MFVGHYSASLAAKAIEPRGPLWGYVAAAQLLDIGWSVLVMGGVEKLRIDPSLPGSALDLYYMPWTHSLPAAVIWSVAAGLACRWLLKWPGRVAWLIGLVVFSHWAADFLVHRPDLLIWPGGEKVGLAWWNYPVPEQALEIGLLGLGGMAWTYVAAKSGKGLFWPLAFVAALVGLQVAVMFMEGDTDPFQMGLSALLVYLIVAAVAWAIDRGKKGKA